MCGKQGNERKFDDNWNPKDGRTAYNPRKKVASLNFTSNKDDMEDDSEMEEDDTLIVLAPKFIDQSMQKVSFCFCGLRLDWA